MYFSNTIFQELKKKEDEKRRKKEEKKKKHWNEVKSTRSWKKGLRLFGKSCQGHSRKRLFWNLNSRELPSRFPSYQGCIV